MLYYYYNILMNHEKVINLSILFIVKRLLGGAF